MERLSQEIYNLNEWLLLRLFRVVTGLKLAYNPDLQQVLLIPIDDVKEPVLNLIGNQITDEFGIQTELLDEKIEYHKALRRHFINTTWLSEKLKKEFPQFSKDKSIALMAVTNYWLAPSNFFLSRFIHTVLPILGITYLRWGICILTTLQGLLPSEFLKLSVIHEVGHLLGKHGYPLRWLQRRKKAAQESKD